MRKRTDFSIMESRTSFNRAGGGKLDKNRIQWFNRSKSNETVEAEIKRQVHAQRIREAENRVGRSAANGPLRACGKGDFPSIA